MLLGGKKAAIKYYYDVKYRAYGEYNEISPEEIENIEVQLKNPNLATKDLWIIYFKCRPTVILNPIYLNEFLINELNKLRILFLF